MIEPLLIVVSRIEGAYNDAFLIAMFNNSRIGNRSDTKKSAENKRS
jgi:hypothetical protein